MKKVAFYGRYSSTNQTEQSIEGQLHVCEKYAAEHDMKIIGKYIDKALTGTSDKRPEFQKMIADSKKGGFEAVLVYKLDRFARNRYDSALYKKKLRDNGVKVVSATENITDTPEGIIMEGLLEAMDEYYSAELSRKTKRGREESFRKGKFIGRLAPFGYKIVDHKLVIDEIKSPIVVELFKRYASGETASSLVNDLNKRGIPNAAGGKWCNANMSAFLKNQIYAGRYISQAMHLEVSCPAIVEPNLFEEVQQKKAESLHQARARKESGTFRYILTGKTVCGKCGHAVCGSSTEAQKYRYYQCIHCKSKRIQALTLHETVRNALHEYLTPDKIEELALAAYKVYTEEEHPTSEREILEQELTTVERKLQNAVKAVLDGFGSEALKITMQELEERRSELQEKLEVLSPPAPKLTLEHFHFAITEIVRKTDTDDLKTLIDTIVNRIVIIEGRAVICINLTDEANTPPLEQISYKFKETWIKFTAKSASCLS